MMAGPLAGIRVIELSAIGPVPYAGMMFADLGAEIIRIDRPGEPGQREDNDPALDVTKRGRRSIVIDLKHEAGRRVLLSLVRRADILFEGGRPGVMERLSVGPDDCLAVNPRLVYARATGWGQDGPYAHRAGHDINFLALTGALWATGRPGERPTAPQNLLGDYGGGGMLLAFGALSALIEAHGSGRGQVVDAAIIDGVASMSALQWSMRARGMYQDERGSNLLDSGAPFYEVYACADGKFIALGAIEPKFFAQFCAGAGVEPEVFVADPTAQAPRQHWPELKQALEELIATRTRDEWVELLQGRDACFAPVLSWLEAADHPHNAARQVYLRRHGVMQPAPAPRFSRTPGAIGRPPVRPGTDTVEILAECGYTTEEAGVLRQAGAVAG
jgi:alpha-methylacyl-CoA racemase